MLIIYILYYIPKEITDDEYTSESVSESDVEKSPKRKRLNTQNSNSEIIVSIANTNKTLQDLGYAFNSKFGKYFLNIT